MTIDEAIKALMDMKDECAGHGVFITMVGEEDMEAKLSEREFGKYLAMDEDERRKFNSEIADETQEWFEEKASGLCIRSALAERGMELNKRVCVEQLTY